jgi:hypothetical protein
MLSEAVRSTEEGEAWSAGDASSAAVLDGLSELAGQAFASTAEATMAVLRLVAEQLGVRSSFLSRITREEGRFEVVAAHNDPGGCDMATGAILSLPQAY